MIRALIRKWAWWILEDEIEQDYIPRGVFNDYTKWMSRDFPIMVDMYEWFKKYGSGKQNKCVSRHRTEMEKKHFNVEGKKE